MESKHTLWEMWFYLFPPWDDFCPGKLASVHVLHEPCVQPGPSASVEAVPAAGLLHTGCTGIVERGAWRLHPG